MFFRILKNDLRHKKGLNIVLFFFMISAAALVFASAVMIYSRITGNDYTREICHISDLTVFFPHHTDNKNEQAEQFTAMLDNDQDVLRYSTDEVIKISQKLITFPEHDNINPDLSFRNMYLTKIPYTNDLLFDTNDQPVWIENGKIGVPIDLNKTLSIGDQVHITTYSGNVYEFTVQCFLKQGVAIDNFGGRFVFSDADFELLAENFPVMLDKLGISFNLDYDGVVDITKEYIDYIIDNKVKCTVSGSAADEYSANTIIPLVISFALILISVFMILIIFMTIRFTMLSALKEDEKEIGIMSAIGIDSFSFKWLLTAKYIALAVSGGLIGIVIGFPISKIMLITFNTNNIFPSFINQILIGSLSVLGIVLLIILFSLRIMRRIDKISVIDAIHGENRGERFNKSTFISLEKCKRIPVPLFLAANDVVSRLKRYIFMIISYALGIFIILTVFNLKNTVISEEFEHYFNYVHMDFDYDVTSKHYNELQRRASAKNVSLAELLNTEMRENNIPAEIIFMKTSDAYCLHDDRKIYFEVGYDSDYINQFRIREGGTMAKLPNEAVMSYYTASKLGIQVGDYVEFYMTEYNDDKVSSKYVPRKLLITGFYDLMESGTPYILLPEEHKELYYYSSKVISNQIHSEDKEQVISQMKDLFGEDFIISGDEVIKEFTQPFDTIFDLMEKVLGTAAVIVSVLITYLYLNIFLTEETNETALLKSLGFSDFTLKIRQLLRLLILAVLSVIIGIILFRTVGTYGVKMIFESLELSGFTYLHEIPVTYFFIPLLFLSAIMATAVVKVQSIDKTNAKDISED